MKDNTIKVAVIDCGFYSIKNYLNNSKNLDVYFININREEDRKVLSKCDIIIPTMAKIDKNILDIAKNIKLIQQWGAGLDGVNIEEATRRGIAVANVDSKSTYNAESVAEWCIMAAISLGRGYPKIHKNVLKGGPWGHPIGESLIGKTVGIVGFGGIGRALAKRLNAFSVNIVAVKRTPQAHLENQYNLRWLKGIEYLDDLLRISKFIFLCLPLNDETKNLIDKKRIANIPKDSYLINASRGDIIEKEAFIEALKNKHIKSAALDVFWEEPTDPRDPILGFDNLLLTPHIAGVTDISYEHISEKVLENIKKIMNKEVPVNCVNIEYKKYSNYR
ncbi:MAG: NAD(P)-dependent oxidoreductase [Deferribacterota bacterium]|nr:NAD(P)-dependent oxidoreductase [Deferribacterota bacterium]